MMTICIVTDGFPPDIGGISTFYGNLAAILAEQKCKVIVLMKDLKESFEEDIIINDGLITKIILRKSYHKQLRYYKKYFRPGGLDAPSWIAMGYCFREWLMKYYKTYGIDIIEVTDYGGLGIFLCDNNLPPAVITGNGSLTQYSRINYSKKDVHYDVITELEKLSFQHADAILSYSPLNQVDLAKTFSQQIDFVPAPWKRNQFQSIHTTVAGSHLVIAGMQLIKGAETLAQALSNVVEQQPTFRIDWIGGDFHTAPGNGSTVAYIEKKYPALWNRNFIWHDSLNREKTIEMLANASLVIIPSVFETFNFVAIEAATLGKPIIITDKTGAVYLFTHGHDACIVNSNDPSALGEAIIFLQTNTDLRNKLGENAQKMIEVVFDPEYITSERKDIYKRVLATRKLHKVDPSDKLYFLEKYLTPVRKFYFIVRAKAKKIIKSKG